MTITYEEFDTTPAGLVAALKTKILLNPHWTDQGVTVVSTTSTGSAASNGNTVTVTSAAGFTVGQWISIGAGGANEQTRQITAINGSTITVTSTWSYTFATGSTVKTRNTVLRSTSDRGAKLIVDLEAGTWDGAAYHVLGVSAYREYTGTAPGGQTDASKSHSLYWKSSTGTATMPLHVVLSVGKNHLFFTIEGPRANEPSATSTTYGSLKTYFSFCDIIPYHVSDTVPAAVLSACHAYNNSVLSSHHLAQISRDSMDTYPWSNGRLASLDWPTMYTTDVVTMPRNCTIDGSTYLFPYVVFSEMEGLRGRLSSFYYCGTTQPSTFDYSEPVGSKVTYDGVVYKLLSINKGDGTSAIWGPFGAISNSTSITRSLVLAVPFAVAA
jgi:hypothetical protein